MGSDDEVACPAWGAGPAHVGEEPGLLDRRALGVAQHRDHIEDHRQDTGAGRSLRIRMVSPRSTRSRTSETPREAWVAVMVSIRPKYPLIEPSATAPVSLSG